MNSPDCHQACLKQNVIAVTNEISLKLKDYTSKKDSAGNGQPSRAAENLASIVRAAIAFDHLLWQQKACFNFRGCASVLKTGGKVYKFDAHWMTSGVLETHAVVLVARENTVRLFSVPALYKKGTSEGDNYSNNVVLCKAHVDCSGSGI